MTNPESMATFKQRIAIIEHFRTLLAGRGFAEVETPMMQSIYGGAAARPFTTHHNALDVDLFLRISPELYLKRLLVGGMEKVFEINRNFRNEGLDTRHNPEFTMMELYQAYADFEVMMEITEELVATAAEEIAIPALRQRHAAALARLEQVRENKGDEAAEEFQAEIEPLCRAVALCDEGKLALPYGRDVIDYTRPWRRATYAELLQEHSGVAMRDSEAVRAKGFDPGDAPTWARLVDDLFSEHVEPKLVQPTFITDYPLELSPLAKRSPEDPRLVERFEPFLAGMEIGNAFSELNDPDDQRQRLEAQVRAQQAGDEEAHPLDEDYIRVLEHGLPPTGGLGIGVDRLVMILADAPNLREVILFPHLRPAQPAAGGRSTEQGREAAAQPAAGERSTEEGGSR